MKKEQREVYVELAQVMNASLCTFCKYGSWQMEGCCEGYNECQHPVEALSWEYVHEESLEPGSDCYGFKANMGVDLVADIAGAIISEGYDEWFYRRYSPESVTVYGRSYDRGVEVSSKVRIVT